MMTDDMKAEQLREIREFFKKDRFAASNGMEVEDAGKGYSLIKLRITEDHKNALGFLMGGVLAAMADFACAVASGSSFKNDVYVSADAHVSFLSAVKGNTLYAAATCIKEGGRLSYYDVIIKDETGKDIAKALFTMYRVDKKS